jgi:purine-binding chemotaxis protein CheW
VDIKEISIGLIVDAVAEVMTIEESNIVSPPDLNQLSRRYIQGIGKSGDEVKILLNCDEMLNHQETENLSAIGQV